MVLLDVISTMLRGYSFSHSLNSNTSVARIVSSVPHHNGSYPV
nr:MAG TPA: hypothetical protein [Crassvirales sp.]